MGVQGRQVTKLGTSTLCGPIVGTSNSMFNNFGHWIDLGIVSVGQQHLSLIDIVNSRFKDGVGLQII